MKHIRFQFDTLATENGGGGDVADAPLAAENAAAPAQETADGDDAAEGDDAADGEGE